MSEIRLSDSFTIFLYAFRYEKGLLQNISNQGFWKVSDIKPDKHFLLDHIQSFFFNPRSRSSAHEIEPGMQIFEVNTDNLDSSRREKLLLYNSLFKRDHCIVSSDQSIEFTICQDKSMLSPKLIFMPFADIGILSFGLRLNGDYSTLKNIEEVNYRLRTFSTNHACQINTEKKSHPRAFEQEKKIMNQLDQLKDTTTIDKSFIWNIGTWIDYLFNGFGNNKEPLTNTSLQAFSYVNIEQELSELQINEEVFRLSRLYPEHILPDKEFFNNRDEIDHTFSKIINGVSLDGGTIMVLPDENPFLTNYAQTVLNRSIWLFLIAYLQRHIFLENILMTSSFLGSDSDSDVTGLYTDQLWKSMFYFDFEEVSSNTNQNDYYRFCSRKMHQSDLKKEIYRKLNYIDSIQHSVSKGSNPGNSAELEKKGRSFKKIRGFFD